MRRTERLGRAYIRYKITPVLILFWIAFGALAWAVLLYASVSLGRYLVKFFEL